jgi:hypothetical protein
MKTMTVGSLRTLIREVLSEDELFLRRIKKGDIVTFFKNNKKLRGKVVDGYKSSFADPNKVKVYKSSEMIWAVSVGGKIYHMPESELQVLKDGEGLTRPSNVNIDSIKFESENNDAEDVDEAESCCDEDDDAEETDEASNIMSRMYITSDEKCEDDDDDELDEIAEGFGHSDTSATAEDEHKREDRFTNKKYEQLARTIIFRYPDKGEHLNWKTVAQNFVRAKRASTGMQLDVNKLYVALTKLVDDMRPERATVEQGQSLASY